MEQDPTQNPQDPNAQAPTGPSSADLTPQQMADNLKQLMMAINDKMNTFNGQKKAASSQLTQIQNDAIQALFQILAKNGVDASDPNAITAFLQQLQQSNPQGYVFFENAISSLLGQKNVLDQEQPPDGFAEPQPPLDQMMGSEPASPGDITANQMPIPNPIPQSMNQPNAQAPLQA